MNDKEDAGCRATKRLKIEDSDKVAILRELLPQFWSEATHWREDSWRFTRWLVGSFIVVSGISVFSEKGLAFASLILLALSIAGTLYLFKNHRGYADRLELFCYVEEALLLFEDGEYLRDKSVIPKTKHPKMRKGPTWWGQGVYIGMIWLVAIAAWLSILDKVVSVSHRDGRDQQQEIHQLAPGASEPSQPRQGDVTNGEVD